MIFLVLEFRDIECEIRFCKIIKGLVSFGWSNMQGEERSGSEKAFQYRRSCGLCQMVFPSISALPTAKSTKWPDEGHMDNTQDKVCIRQGQVHLHDPESASFNFEL